MEPSGECALRLDYKLDFTAVFGFFCSLDSNDIMTVSQTVRKSLLTFCNSIHADIKTLRHKHV